MDHGKIDPDLARRLMELRHRIELHKIPPSMLDESLNVAIWNVRDFGKKRRSKDAIHMIAEILYQFDLVAFIELGEDLTELRRVIDILGPYWSVVYNDAVPGTAGNRERVGFLYDKRMAVFNGFAAEADPKTERPKGKTPDGRRYDYQPEFNFWRSPYMASFRAGSFDFVLLATHIRWDAGNEDRRIAELDYLARWVDMRRRMKTVVDKDIIVLGDFNTPSQAADDKFFAALTGHGLRVPDALAKAGDSNFLGGKRYDHILIDPRETKTFTDNGGVLRFASPSDFKDLLPDVATAADFTYQLSDHFPVWAQINTNLDDERLDQIIAQAKP